MTSALIKRIRPQGDRCLIIDLGDQIDQAVGLRCLTLADSLRQAKVPGVLDIVPSFTAVAIYFDASPALGDNPIARLTALVQDIVDQIAEGAELSARRIQIPVCYGDKHGPDLDDVAKRMGLSPDEVVQAHHGSICRVYMIGFAPGHPYIGIHDERFALPRREVPRTALPAGSLGIANRQSTIYPNVLPGGWHIIGATPLRLFNDKAAQPTLLMPGDEIEFVPIDAQRFEQIKAEQEGGA
ncbi:MAG: 5-oxoprolinase subunit PxpB [Burkholderiaceae bacterium]|nr:5-oxoprolinase subunit PxpB [Burkholderiaceae bacterium]MCD8517436.1 5-oxoprolinase subunit PxpB [Burkholderiaceae bacterium]MCD8537211.1 5-oxoprolinase subunit PxpB [Burkholderiaceae bacterium]MCD8564950.1 5-oxoprolinase subunit PxpB [Burkholderiaceae bacterium]